MKKAIFSSIVIVLFISACSKDSDPPNGSDNSIQKQIVNTKWYYDSTVFWNEDAGFDDILDYNNYNQKTYLYFGEDSTITEYYWTGVTYKTTSYPYVWNGDVLVCDYDFLEDSDFPYIQIKGNQLIFGEVPTLPRKTDTSGQIELLWWYYHR